jgi:hypothetical protein
MATKKRFEEQLRDAINGSGLSRYAICKEIGLPESTMSHFMAGNCGLSVESINRICELIGARLVAGKPARKLKARPAKARRGRKERP